MFGVYHMNVIYTAILIMQRVALPLNEFRQYCFSLQESTTQNGVVLARNDIELSSSREAHLHPKKVELTKKEKKKIAKEN